MQAHPTMEILPFGDAYLEAGCLVLKGLSPRGAVPQGPGCSGSQQTTQQRQAPRCCEQAGWQATGALESHLVISHPLSQPHTVLAHSVCRQAWAAQLWKVLAEVEPPALAEQPCSPGCWHDRGGHGSPGSRSSLRPWESCQQLQELCSPLGIWDSS